MLEGMIKRYAEEAGYGQKEKALFYLGILAGAVAECEERLGKMHSGYKEMVYKEDYSETNIMALYSETLAKLTEYGLKNGLAWAVKEFLDNYTDEAEKTPPAEKRCCVISGIALYRAASPYLDNEWMLAKEATKRWRLGESTIRSAIKEGRLVVGEYEKRGRDWYVKKSAIERLYGNLKNKRKGRKKRNEISG